MLCLYKIQLRSFLSLALALGGLICYANVTSAQQFDLEVDFPKNKQVRVTSNFEHVGDVLVITDPVETKESKKKKEKPKPGVKPLRLSVEAKMTYAQRTMGATQSIRYFENASAKIKLDKGTTNPRLTENNRLVVARSQEKSKGNQEVEMASVKDTLQESELDLIQNPADPMTLADLLNKDGVKQGDSWKPTNIALAKFLGLNEINESDVKITLKSLDSKSARVFVAGQLVADVDDVSTKMQISGVAVVDRASKMLSSFKLGINETKNPGQISPGFKGNTKIDLRFTPINPLKALSNESLAVHVQGGKIRQRLKWVSQLALCELIYEPRWKMITQEQEAALLRFIDGKELLTQCNVVLLPNRAKNKPLTLDQYKREIAKIADKDKNAKLVSAVKSRLSGGETCLRVVVSGVEGGVPVQWFYYNVAAYDGRQIAFVFTLESSVASRVTGIAKQLVKEFRFIDLPRQVANKNSASASKKATSKSKYSGPSSRQKR